MLVAGRLVVVAGRVVLDGVVTVLEIVVGLLTVDVLEEVLAAGLETIVVVFVLELLEVVAGLFP